MIKNLIFDLDDTIIKDEVEDSLCYKEALINCGYNGENYKAIYEAIDKYDKLITEDNMYYDKNEMLNTINKLLHTNYDIKLIDEMLKLSGKYWTKRVIIKEDILKKLSEKYNLYVYTNYFTEVQENRLKNIGYLKFFKKVFGADKYGSKPFKKSFEIVLNEISAKPKECIMIGDNIARDILAANNIGMKSILYDYNGKRDISNYNLINYKSINKFDQIFDTIEKLES